MNVTQAITALQHTHKKGARLIEDLLKSAVANAQHNDKQDAVQLVIKTIIVNQGSSYRRGVPMARGRMRPMRKFLSHISVTLGIATEGEPQKPAKKTKSVSSQAKKHPVQDAANTKEVPSAS